MTLEQDLKKAIEENERDQAMTAAFLDSKCVAYIARQASNAFDEDYDRQEQQRLYEAIEEARACPYEGLGESLEALLKEAYLGRRVVRSFLTGHISVEVQPPTKDDDLH